MDQKDDLRSTLRDIASKVDKVSDKVDKVDKTVTRLDERLAAHVERPDIHQVPPCGELQDVKGRLTWVIRITVGALITSLGWGLSRIIDNG